MRRRFRIWDCRIWRRTRKAERALRPLLSSLYSAPPPEGLLREVERRIDAVPPKRRLMPETRWIALPLTAALIAGLVSAYAFLPQSPRSVLVDPAGMPLAHLDTDGSAAVVSLAAGRRTRGAGKAWHLWGFRPDAGPPVLLGPLAAGGLRVSRFKAFSGFAMSLESTGFQGDTPVGPVLFLTAVD